MLRDYLDINERNKIYDDLITKFGPKTQVIVAIEELSELQKELCKYLRNNEQLFLVKGIIEELADVEIMLEQLKRLFGPVWAIEEIKDYKVRRAQERYLTEVKNEQCKKID